MKIGVSCLSEKGPDPIVGEAIEQIREEAIQKLRDLLKSRPEVSGLYVFSRPYAWFCEQTQDKVLV